MELGDRKDGLEWNDGLADLGLELKGADERGADQPLTPELRGAKLGVELRVLKPEVARELPAGMALDRASGDVRGAVQLLVERRGAALVPSEVVPRGEPTVDATPKRGEVRAPREALEPATPAPVAERVAATRGLAAIRSRGMARGAIPVRFTGGP